LKAGIIVLLSVSISGETVLYAVQNLTVPERLSSEVEPAVAVASVVTAPVVAVASVLAVSVVDVGAEAIGVAVGASVPHALRAIARISNSAWAVKAFRRNIFVSFLRVTFNFGMTVARHHTAEPWVWPEWPGEPDHIWLTLFLLNLIICIKLVAIASESRPVTGLPSSIERQY
jgi:hypothetical protein